MSSKLTRKQTRRELEIALDEIKDELIDTIATSKMYPHVCGWSSQLVYQELHKKDFDVTIISGDFDNSYHVWCEVELEDETVIVDFTRVQFYIEYLEDGTFETYRLSLLRNHSLQLTYIIGREHRDYTDYRMAKTREEWAKYSPSVSLSC